MLPDESAFEAMRSKLGDLGATVQVIKHEVANAQQAAIGRDLRFDKFEERTRVQFDEMRKETSASLKEVNETITQKFEGLSGQIAALNVGHGKGLGFVAGATAVIGFCITIIMFFAKLFFGVQGQ